MHAASAAEGDECEVARVVAAVDGDELQRVDHVVVRDPDDASGCVDAVDTQLVRDGAERTLHRGHIRPKLAAAEVLGVDPAEREVGIGRGGRGSATSVRHRPRHRAC